MHHRATMENPCYRRFIYCIASFCLPVVPLAAVPDPSLYFSDPHTSRLSIRQDGRYISFLSNQDGHSAIRIVDLEKGENRNIEVNDDQRILVASWSGIDGHLVYLQTHTKLPLALFRYEVAKRQFRLMRLPETLSGDTNSLSIVDFIPRDPDKLRIFLRDSYGNHYYDYDLNNISRNRFREVFPKDATNIMFDRRDGNAVAYLRSNRANYDFFMKDEDRHIETIYHRPAPSADFTPLEGFHADFSQPGDIYNNRYPFGVSYDGQILYYAAITEHETFGIYAYHLAEKKELGIILQHPEYDCYFPGKVSQWHRNDLQHLIYSDQSENLIGFKTLDILPGQFWLDPKFNRIQQILNELLPNQINLIADWDLAEEKFIILSYGAKEPDSFFLLDVSKPEIKPIAQFRKGLNSTNIAHIYPLKIPLRDGTQMLAYLHAPPGTVKIQNLRVLIEPLSGMNYRTVYERDPLADFMASQGYATLKISTSGSIGFGRKFFERGFAENGERVHQDVEDVARFLIDKKICKVGNLALYGKDEGAYISLQALIRTPDLYSAAILENPFIQIETYLRETYRSRARSERWNYFEMLQGMQNRSSPDFSRFYNPDDLENIKAAVMCISPLTVWQIHRDAADLHSALKSRGKTTQHISLHHYRDTKSETVQNRIKQAQAIVDFLQQNMVIQ